MTRKTVDEKFILQELSQVPQERWGEVVLFLRSLQAGRQPPPSERPIHSGAELAGSDLIGIWADRKDIVDSREFARELRHRAEHRRGTTDVAGH